MQTLTQKPLEFLQTHDTQYVIYSHARNVGTIAFDMTAMKWEYSPYSKPAKAALFVVLRSQRRG